VNLSSAFGTTNGRTGITTDGVTFTGGLDGNGHAYSASQLTSPVTWNTLPFTLGPVGMHDAVAAAGQMLSLPNISASALSFLATGVNGNGMGQLSQNFTVTYTDGSMQTFTQSLSDWTSPATYSGEGTAVTMSYWNNADGTRTTQPVYLHAYSFALNPAKMVQSLTLPNNGNVVLLAATLTNADWSPATNTLPSNMVQVSANVYDGGGVGDSDLTSHFDYPTPPTSGNPNPADQRESDNLYDWRDRPVVAKDGAQATEDHITHRPIFYTEHDNLGETVFSERYDGDGVTLGSLGSTNGVPNRPSAGLLRSKTGSKYDNQGRVYQSNQFYVDQTSGTVANSTLDTNNWYDHRGNRIKTSVPGGQVTKTSYDGADRPTITYTTDGGYDALPGQTGNWTDATNTLGDNVFTQVETTYDGDGNPTLVTTRQRFHDNPLTVQGVDGALKDHNTLPKARVSFVASFYDAADRLVNQEDLGTFGGRPCDSMHSCPPAPVRSDTVLVTSYGYGADAVQQVSITGSPPPGSTFNLTFTNICDLGDSSRNILVDRIFRHKSFRDLGTLGTVHVGPWTLGTLGTVHVTYW
jgi:YD repeat-containing protein